MEEDGEFAYLANGRERKIESPKKKKIKHLQFISESECRAAEKLRSGEKCSCVLLEKLQISQSTLSYHMKILCDSGVVVGRAEGKWTHYGISEEGSRYAKALLDTLTQTNTCENGGCGCQK